jgi:hypothetical protein
MGWNDPAGLGEPTVSPADRTRAPSASARATVIDLACGTSLNFPLLRQAVGPGGRTVGVDLTDAILSTYALTEVPQSVQVIAHGTAALSAGGRWATLDLKLPGRTPGWLARRPWETIRAAMQDELAGFAWTELCLGTAFLAAGSRPSS